MRMREAQVVAAVTEWTSRQGMEYSHEFPVLGRVADVFALHSLSGDTLAVECKERDWRKGIRQARVYSVAADHVFIALPSPRVTPYALNAIGSEGFGVLAVTEDGGVVVALAAPPTCALPTLKQRTVSMFTSRRGSTHG